MNRNHANLTETVIVALAVLLTPSILTAQRTPTSTMRATPAPVRAVRNQAPPVPSSGLRVNVRRGGAGQPAMRLDSGHGTMPRPMDAFGFEGSSPLSIQDLLNIAPEFGFNWQFVDAMNRDLLVKAFIDPVTQVQVAEALHLLRGAPGAFPGTFIVGGGPYYSPPETGEEQVVEQPRSSAGQPAQPQIIVLQQSPQPERETEKQAPAQEPIPDRGHIALVLRTGKQLQTVAFTHAKGQIVYITPEGNRLTIEATELDAEATVRLNEEHGTSMKLPL